MNRKWIVNSSPLIALAKVGQIQLFSDLFDEVIIPSGVAEEIEQGPEDDPARIWLRDYGTKWIQEVGRINPIIMAWDLGRGESEVISMAYENSKYGVIIDDRAARNCAFSMGIKVLGTIGIILLAKRRKMINQVSSVLDELCRVGFRVSPKLFDTALTLSNENLKGGRR